jgi:hypothetical protein
MNIKELNKLIKEELDAFLEAEDDIQITTDEPDIKSGQEAIDLLRQIYDLIKPEIDGAGASPSEPDMNMDMDISDMGGDEEEPEEEEEEEEEEDKKDNKKDKEDKDDKDKKLQESYMRNRFKKLANIRG